MQGKDVVLGLLNQRDMSGYEIKEVFETQLKFFFDGTFGMIYPILRKLEKDGLIQKKHVVQDLKPNKNIYSITELGKKEFMTYLNSKTVEETFKSDFLMRMYFGQDLDRDKVISFVEQEITRKKTNLSELTDNYERWTDNGMNSFQEITFMYGIAYYKSEIEVLDKALEQLKNQN
ncbi:PadR family transcriptional regulator [Lacticaseibacillus casei]|uniref:PadR family transcriptional regulator n=1 Tax=Lacticaseibacillus huelsenbergensis TaxID=3035291 RepID=A0ABY8DZC8_9LACO|nr:MULTISPECIES: PadR family transcriptional regulator [Lacticaseibacillus]MDG3062406.1 PadR family transcriptional regulator [Lacticaseibacillus sp. BCRC 81376]QVI36353.1 PadR family transcriptional regulator [Lacticaseibacillus casei]QXG58152.1 PadR family transcriptional regulator [Lacticaseibacillus casei]WFB40373.1 PadR family transcriptional regulator [Lacticaseibacillus huelsenbergensis]WFB42126.1 PadR family transcriptional regulator [Lacticaseibacillus huelsenbergensis]